MTDATHLFSDRITEIDHEIDSLKREREMLSKFRHSLGSWPQVLRDTDRFTPRTATKFELLARVVNYLNSQDPFMYGGAGTREIYDAVAEGIRGGTSKADARDAGITSENPEIAPHTNTPFEESGVSVNYNTFRSYLARFRAEGRIFFNEETRRWRVSEDEIQVLLPSPKDGDRDDWS